MGEGGEGRDDEGAPGVRVWMRGGGGREDERSEEAGYVNESGNEGLDGGSGTDRS